MNIIIIDNKVITTLEELKECCNQPEAKQANSSLFNALKSSMVDKDISMVLCSIGEDKLAKKISEINMLESGTEMIQFLISTINEVDMDSEVDSIPIEIEFDPMDYLKIVQADIVGNEAVLQIEIVKQAHEKVEFIIKQGSGGKRSVVNLFDYQPNKNLCLKFPIDLKGKSVAFLMNGKECKVVEPTAFDPLKCLEIVQVGIEKGIAVMWFRLLKESNEKVECVVKQGNRERKAVVDLQDYKPNGEFRVRIPVEENDGEVSFYLCHKEIGKKSPQNVGKVGKTVTKLFGGIAPDAKQPIDNDAKTSMKNKVIDVVDGLKITMKFVEGGKFLMGAQRQDPSKPNYNPNATNQEARVHEVKLSSFYIGESVVSQALWKSFMGTEPLCYSYSLWSEKGRGDDLPAYGLKWNEIQSFIHKLNKKTNMSFQLPTEAQWEYAAMDYRNHMLGGDVAEWCYDWYGTYHRGLQIDPKGPDKGKSHVVRGGRNYNNESKPFFSRRHEDPESSITDVGFRLCLPI